MFGYFLGLAMVSVLLWGCLFAQPPDIDSRFHTYDEVIAELQTIAEAYTSLCKVETLGISTGDSIPIVAAKISDNAHTNEDESVILIIAGQHARELLGTEVTIWLMNYLTANYASDSDVRKWVDSLEIWFIPVDNPEGRNIIMTEGPQHTLHWRKNKRDNNGDGIFDTIHDGVDPNRNYDFRWDEFEGTDWSSEDYKGTAPWSENEAVVIRDFVDYYRPTVVLDLHSPDVSGGNKMWFCWYDSTAMRYHPEGYPHYYLTIQEMCSQTQTEVSGTFYSYLAAYNTKPKLQTWVFAHTGMDAILIEITNKCYWHGDTIDTIVARVGRGIFTIFDRMFERGLVVKAFDSRHGGIPVRAEVIIEGVTDTTLPPRLCNYHGRFHRFLDKSAFTTMDTYDVRLRYGDSVIVFEDVIIQPGQNTYLFADFDYTGISERQIFSDAISLDYHNNSIVCSSENATLGVYDINGREVFRKDVSGKLTVSLKNLPNGIYLLKLTAADGATATKKIQIMR